MEEWKAAAEVARLTSFGKTRRIMAICGLVGLAICYVALKVIDWNDCAMHAATIGIPTTFTLDEGCLVLSTGGAHSADNYAVNHPTLISFFVLLRFFCVFVSVIFVGGVVTDFINDKRVAKHIAKGFHHYEPAHFQLASIREVQSDQHHKRIYQLTHLCTKLITYEGSRDSAYLPTEKFDTIEDFRERIGIAAWVDMARWPYPTDVITEGIEIALDNASLPNEEFDTIEEARVRMELIAPVGKWIPNG